MAARDKYHQEVRTALEKEGWKITHDPYFVRLGKRKGFIDLGAEIIGAERGLEKIAVEIKSFQVFQMWMNLKMHLDNFCFTN